MADNPGTATPNLVSMAQQFTGLPMQDLIGGPLMAAATANNDMALTQVKFLMDTCFEPGSTSGSYVPIMIDMSLTQGVLQPGVITDGVETTPPKMIPITTAFNLPLLTILPLNSLAVDDVLVKFNMQVKSSYSQKVAQSSQSKGSGTGKFSGTVGWGPVSATVTGSVSYSSEARSSDDSHYAKSNSAQYGVRVHAGQLPLPEGVKTIITAFADSIGPQVLPAVDDTSG